MNNENNNYEKNLAAIREERAREVKRKYYLEHREKMLAYSREYKKTYHPSEIQRKRYNMKQNEKYRTDPLFRQKTLDRMRLYRKKKNVIRIIGILQSIITSKEAI